MSTENDQVQQILVEVHPGILNEEQKRLERLREHYAGLAMQGCLAGHLAHCGHDDYWKPSGVADHAVDCADALIAALKAVKP